MVERARSEESKTRKRETDRVRSRTRVNIGDALTDWRELRATKRLSSDSEVATFLLDFYQSHVLKMSTPGKGVVQPPPPLVSSVTKDSDWSQRQQQVSFSQPAPGQSELRIIKCVSLRTGAEADVTQAAGGGSAEEVDHLARVMDSAHSGAAPPHQVDERHKVKLRKTSETHVSSLEKPVEGRTQEHRTVTRRTAPQRTNSPTPNMRLTRSGSTHQKLFL